MAPPDHRLVGTPAVSSRVSALLMLSLRVLLTTALLVGAPSSVAGDPWDLPAYSLCRHTTLSGIPAEASGVTYSPVTNSIWVMTRRPQAFMEYTVMGLKLREVPYEGLSDPEGITWMYDYTFAVAQEGGATAAIVIMDLLPWRESAYIRRKLVLDGVKCEQNFCFEGITYNVRKNVFYALQEQNPMKVWQVSPGSGTAVEVLDGEKRWPKMRDLAGAYFRPASSTGIFLLSQTEQTVNRINFNGTALQQVKVNDNMVEGLTFTPDGKLMITVGEPNDLWIYNSTDSCESWKLDPKYKPPQAPPKVQQERMARLVAPLDQDPDGGYCNWKGCNRKPEGNAWCNQNMDRCVGSCGGSWCWWDGVGKTITPEDYAAGETPEPTEEPTPTPTTLMVAEESVMADQPPADAGEDNTTDSVATQLREGFCNWRDCGKGRMGSDECNFSPKVCTQSCGGQWCWGDGLDPPLQKTNLSTSPPSAGDEGQLVPATVQEAEPQQPTAEAPVPTLDQDSIPDNMEVVEVEDDSFKKMGYEGMVQLLLDNITVAQFTPLQQLYFRQAIAHVAYGRPGGFLQVVFNTTTLEMSNDYALFKGYLMPATLDRLAEKALGEEVAEDEDVLVLTAHLLGATQRHAINVTNKTVAAVSSGKLATSLDLMGFAPNITVQVLKVNITQSAVAPEFFPSSAVENVTYGPNYTVVQVDVVNPFNESEIIQVVRDASALASDDESSAESLLTTCWYSHAGLLPLLYVLSSLLYILIV